jgi:hypothetical protein
MEGRPQQVEPNLGASAEASPGLSEHTYTRAFTDVPTCCSSVGAGCMGASKIFFQG